MNVAVRPEHGGLNFISLCTGGGGLDRAVELAIPEARPVLCVEREAFAVANLVAQMQQHVMAAAPIWSDVRTVPGRRFRGAVDGVIGGIPCQPYSLAGKRLGREDERDLWGPARRIFVASGAWFILIENVGGMLSEGGAERVRRDLLRLGCKVEGGLFRASEVGASHERERLFILGVADRDGQHGHRRGVFRLGWRGQPTDGRGCVRLGVGLADPSRPELQGGGPDGHRPGECSTAERGGSSLVNTPSIGRREGRPEPEFRSGRGSAGGAVGELADAHEPKLRRVTSAGELEVLQFDDGTGGRPVDDPARDDGRLYAGRRGQGFRTFDTGGTGQVADPFGRGRDGRPQEPQWSPEERAAVEWASSGPLFAPGPANGDIWRQIAWRAPERLPALSRHDLFRIEIGKARAAAHGLAAPGSSKAWGDSPPETWLDQSGPYGLRPAIVQEIAKSTLRRGFDGVAARIDELRMLGNGVVDLEGAYALRALATDLAARSSGAARLVRMMEGAA